MESSNLNLPPPDDRELEARLRLFGTAAVPNDGFSERVLAALPDPAHPPAAWRRWAWPVAGGLVGLAVSLSRPAGSGLGPLLAQENQVLAQGIDILLNPEFGLVLAAGSAVLAIWLALDERVGE